MERVCAVLARKVKAVVGTCEWQRVTQNLVLVADTRPASVCAQTQTNTHLFTII
jgi:Flp pilus assembly protein TadD